MFIDRDNEENIIAAFARPQSEGQESIADDHADYLAFVDRDEQAKADRSTAYKLERKLLLKAAIAQASTEDVTELTTELNQL